MRRVLYLDIEPKNLDDYRQISQVLDVEGYYAKNAVEAHRIIDHHELDLIVADYNLQEENGVEFLSGVREYNSDIPLIMMGGKKEEDLAHIAMNLHIIQDYVEKPLNINVFNRIVNRYIKHA